MEVSMSESERRHVYRYSRVLIETARILSPQFADAVIHVTGAQLEILRNLMQYANREDTFVTTYGKNTYLSPTAGEWDSLLAIIADLEGKLMGNDNIIWGFHNRYADTITTPGTGGTIFQTYPLVPNGEVHVVSAFIASPVQDDHPSTAALEMYDGAAYYRLITSVGLTVHETLVAPGTVYLEAGDRLRVTWWESVLGKTYRSTAWGYIMDVPE